jgi:hypothetical protein
MKRTFLSSILSLIIMISVSGCASPTVDTSTDTFDEEKYSEDLNACRGGSAAYAVLGGLGGVVVGSLWGASEGFQNGALSGGSVEGAIIGGIVGGSLGIFVGAYKPFSDKEDSVRECLREKGYLLKEG